MITKVCVFCASSTQVAGEYLDAASEVGRLMAINGVTVLYGGGFVGSMGALSGSIILNKGQIIGIIPRFMMEMNWGNSKISELIVVETLAERKSKMIENIDAAIALPGGTGTFEELTEVISLKKLGLFTKPIIIINTNGFYDYFLKFYEQMILSNFIRPNHRNLFSVINKPEEIFESIKKAPAWDSSAIKIAAL